MVRPNGERTTLFVENYIPYVPNPDYDQSSDVKTSKAAPATASIMPMEPPMSPRTVARHIRTADDILSSDTESSDNNEDTPPLVSSCDKDGKACLA